MSNSQDKIFIAEISDDLVHSEYFPFNAFTWGLKTNNDYTGIASPDYELENIGVNNPNPVISFSVGQTQYQRVFTESDVILFDGTFYYDDQLLLVHFTDNKTPYHFASNIIKIGFAIGLYNSPKDIDGIFNNAQYYPRLLNNTAIKSKKDDIFEQRQVFPNIKIDVDNADMRFKNFNIGVSATRKNGSLVRLLSWTGADATQAQYSDFTLDHQGVISSTSEGEMLNIELKDLRTTLTDKTPTNTLDNANFPYIKSGTYRKPQVWGRTQEIPCICLNEEVNKDIDVIANPGTSTDYIFMICDTSKRTIASDSIKSIYISNELKNISSTVQYDAINDIAYFTISETFFRKTETDDSGTVNKIDWENQSKVSINCNGYLDNDTSQLIENGLEVIRSIILDVYEKPFIDAFYDTTTWTFFESQAYNIQYYLEKPISVQKQIEQIQSTQLGKFIYDSQLRFSFDNDEFTETIADISKYQFFGENFIPKFKSNPKQVLNTYRVGYNKRWSVSNKELANTWYKDTSNSDNAIENYNSYVEKDYTTLLTNEVDSIDFGNRLLFEAGNSIDTVDIETLWDYRTLKSGEWVKLQADLVNESYLGWTICQIQEVTPKIDNWSVTLKLRVMSYLSVWGTSDNDIMSTDSRQKIAFTR